MKILFLANLVFIFIFSFSDVNAQDKVYDSIAVKPIQDPEIDSLYQKYIELNKYIETIEGYRIQIFFDAGNNSKDNAYRVKESFLESFPGVDVYITFREPYYRVRVGNFRSRMEAEGFLYEIKADYPNAFSIKDDIFPIGETKYSSGSTEESSTENQKIKNSF